MYPFGSLKIGFKFVDMGFVGRQMMCNKFPKASLVMFVLDVGQLMDYKIMYHIKREFGSHGIEAYDIFLAAASPLPLSLAKFYLRRNKLHLFGPLFDERR